MSILPVPPYARKRIEDELHHWLARDTGVGDDRCWWQDQDIVESPWPFATLAWVATTPVGMPAQSVEVLIPNPLPPGTTTEPDVRLITGVEASVLISAQVFADPKGPVEGQPGVRLEAAVIRLQRSDVRKVLRDAGLVVVSVTGVTNRGAGQAQVDITCRLAMNDVEDTVSIQQVKVYPTINDVDLQAFVVPEGGTYAPPTIYFGAAIAVVDEAAVLALSSRPIDSFPMSLPFTAGAGQYAFVVLPSSYLPTFTFNGFAGGFIKVGSIVVAGVTCDLWRSVNAGLGNFAVEIDA